MDDDGPREVVPVPPGCKSAEQIESNLISIATLCEAQARIALEDESMMWHRYGAATKLIDSAIKALRGAGQAARDRELGHTVESQMKRLAKLQRRARH